MEETKLATATPLLRLWDCAPGDIVYLVPNRIDGLAAALQDDCQISFNQCVRKVVVVKEKIPNLSEMRTIAIDVENAGILKHGQNYSVGRTPLQAISAVIQCERDKIEASIVRLGALSAALIGATEDENGIIFSGDAETSLK